MDRARRRAAAGRAAEPRTEGARHRSPNAPTPRDELDRRLERLAEASGAWAATPPAERAALLRDAMRRLLALAPDWVAWAVREKGEAPDGPVAGEEWISGPMVTIRAMRLLAETLERGDWSPPEVEPRPGGRTAARVFPGGLLERALYPGVTAEVWFPPGGSASRGELYREGGGGAAGVALVLGAGNVGSIAPLDALDQLIVRGRVALVKMNPVNAYLGPLLERAFARFVARGFLAFAYGGAEVGAYLTQHPLVEAIHLTGSRRTFDAIVWGSTEEERARRRARHEPIVDKPVTAELGCVTPVIVVPGRWSPAEVTFQARRVAAMVAHNASFNCNAAKVLLTPRDWYLREAFLEEVAEALAATPARTAYYPGARERHAAFLERYRQARPLGEGRDGALPWTLIPDVPAREGEYALVEEAFCGVLAEAPVGEGDTGDPQAFLRAAVRIANERIEGTLSCALLVDPRTERALGAALDEALVALRYGGIGVNLWPGVLYGLGVTTWGAFPGHTREAIGSGIGVVHNTRLFDRPERSVGRGPFVAALTPPWFADFRAGARLGPRITRFEAAPSAAALPGLTAAALSG